MAASSCGESACCLVVLEATIILKGPKSGEAVLESQAAAKCNIQANVFIHLNFLPLFLSSPANKCLFAGAIKRSIGERVK